MERRFDGMVIGFGRVVQKLIPALDSKEPFNLPSERPGAFRVRPVCLIKHQRHFSQVPWMAFKVQRYTLKDRMSEEKMIPIEVRSKSHSADAEVSRFAEQRVKYALDRLRDLRRVVVSIEDVNGPKGGPDKHCRIIAEFGFGSIAAEETRTTWKGAVGRAIHRVATNAARELQRINHCSLHRQPSRGL